MTLLDHYLSAVWMNLPKGADKRDILAELRGHLESKMSERAADLGRPLTDSEQEAVLAEFGDPFTIASRYHYESPGRGLAFGPFQLLSPEAFRVWIGVMILVLAINVVIGSVEALLTEVSALSIARRLGVGVLGVCVVVTFVFAGIDFFLRRSARKQRGAPESWLFYSPYLKYVPKWYSTAGLILLSTVALLWGLWWGVFPEVPALLVGPAADALELSPRWQVYQLLLLGLLLLGAGQRAFSLARPELTWVPWVVRLATNVACVALLYPILDSGQLVVVGDPVAAGTEAMELAQRISDGTRGWIRGFGFYWALNTLWIGFVCANHVLHRAGRGRESGLGAASRTTS
jgi:hypothetical protein